MRGLTQGEEQFEGYPEQTSFDALNYYMIPPHYIHFRLENRR